MNKYLWFAVLVLILLVGGTLTGPFAQEGSYTKKKEVQLVGCLEEGDEEGYFVLALEDDEEVYVTGTAELENHLGHRVRLTGQWVMEDEEEIFEVSKIDHLAADCE